MYLSYYFRFSGLNEDFFDKTYESIIEIKSSITGEIAEKFTKLLTPVPNVFMVNADEKTVSYNEGLPNPAKSEKFKNWLDDYLKDKESFFIKYYQTRTVYRRWRCCRSFSRYYALILSIFEVLLLAGAGLLPQYCKEGQSSVIPLLCMLLKSHAFVCFSIISLTIGICMIIYLHSIYSKLRKIKDKYYGL